MTKTLLKKLLKYQNKWVALNEEKSEIVASGSTIQEVEASLEEKQITIAIVTKVLPKDQLYAPNNY